eukprot:gene25052-10701_t
MGNFHSTFIEADPYDYMASWRSAKAIRLDVQCGPDRDPVLYGKSFRFLELNGKGRQTKVYVAPDSFALATDQRPHYCRQVESPITVARWRVRMYAARRRLAVQIGIAVLLSKRTCDTPNHMDSLGFCIPLMLRENVKPFLTEQNNCIDLINELMAYQTLILRENAKPFLTEQNNCIALVNALMAYQDLLDRLGGDATASSALPPAASLDLLDTLGGDATASSPAPPAASLVRSSATSTVTPFRSTPDLLGRLGGDATASSAAPPAVSRDLLDRLGGDATARSALPPAASLVRSSAPTFSTLRPTPVPYRQEPQSSIAGALMSATGTKRAANGMAAPRALVTVESGKEFPGQTSPDSAVSPHTIQLPPQHEDALLDAYVSNSVAANQRNGAAVGGRMARQVRASDSGTAQKQLAPLPKQTSLFNRMTRLISRQTTKPAPTPSSMPPPQKLLVPQKLPQKLAPLTPTALLTPTPPPDSAPRSSRNSKQLQAKGPPTPVGQRAAVIAVDEHGDRMTAPPSLATLSNAHDYCKSALEARLIKLKAMPMVAQKKELTSLLYITKKVLLQSESNLHGLIGSCNGEWADRRLWAAAEVDDEPVKPSWLDSDIYAVYSSQVMLKLKMGAFAVQIHADEDCVKMPRAPVAGSSGTKQNMCYGSRVIHRMVESLHCIGGHEAVEKLTLILHISDEQVYQLQADVWAFPDLYKRIKERLLLVVHHRQSGYSYDPDLGSFVQDPASCSDSLGSGFSMLQDPASCSDSLGSGYSMLQLTYEGEAAVLSADEGDGHLIQAQGSVMGIMQKRGVEWLLSWRARDLGLLSTESVFDVPTLAYMLRQQKSTQARVFIEMISSDFGAESVFDVPTLAYMLPQQKATQARVFTEVCKTPRPELIDKHDSAMLNKIPRPAMGPDAINSGSAKQYPVELRCSDFASVSMKEQLKRSIIHNHGLAVVGMHR